MDPKIDEAIKTLRILRRPATDLERDLALTVVVFHMARSLALSSVHPTVVIDGIARRLAEGIDRAE